MSASVGMMKFPIYQSEFQDPRMEVPYHIRPYFVGIFPYIGLIYGRYFQFRYLKWPLNIWKVKKKHGSKPPTNLPRLENPDDFPSNFHSPAPRRMNEPTLKHTSWQSCMTCGRSAATCHAFVNLESEHRGIAVTAMRTSCLGTNCEQMWPHANWNSDSERA